MPPQFDTKPGGAQSACCLRGESNFCCDGPPVAKYGNFVVEVRKGFVGTIRVVVVVLAVGGGGAGMRDGLGLVTIQLEVTIRKVVERSAISLMTDIDQYMLRGREMLARGPSQRGSTGKRHWREKTEIWMCAFSREIYLSSK